MKPLPDPRPPYRNILAQALGETLLSAEIQDQYIDRNYYYYYYYYYYYKRSYKGYVSN
jgi:hypothetical protein